MECKYVRKVPSGYEFGTMHQIFTKKGDVENEYRPEGVRPDYNTACDAIGIACEGLPRCGINRIDKDGRVK